LRVAPSGGSFSQSDDPLVREKEGYGNNTVEELNSKLKTAVARQAAYLKQITSAMPAFVVIDLQRGCGSL
jgi:3-dehydroquinate dehydratase